jgi:hypothetical protein
MECDKFYDKVLKDRNLLCKVSSSENTHGMSMMKCSPPLHQSKSFCVGSVRNYCKFNIFM